MCFLQEHYFKSLILLEKVWRRFVHSLSQGATSLWKECSKPTLFHVESSSESILEFMLGLLTPSAHPALQKPMSQPML